MRRNKGGLYRMIDGERVLVERTNTECRYEQQAAAQAEPESEPETSVQDASESLSPSGQEPTEVAVNINTATLEEIASAAVRIGEKTARDIVKYRQARGPFESLDELTDVGGVSESIVELNRERLTV